MTDSLVKQTLQRILAVDWHYDPAHRGSHVQVMKEHFRRMVIWSQALELKPIVFMGDLGAAINPEVRAAGDTISQLRDHLLDRTWPGFVKLLEYALHWAAVNEATPLLRKYRSLPDPYEPVLVLYERGGAVRIDRKTGELLLSMTAEGPIIVLENWWKWKRRNPFIELDAAALDVADAQWDKRFSPGHDR
ncbi:MAG: hypothetical protein GYB66_02020 [Chloroflexi bacterium]|nr:hypothetical protein [Chloroflexota bacterium]